MNVKNFDKNIFSILSFFASYILLYFIITAFSKKLLFLFCADFMTNKRGGDSICSMDLEVGNLKQEVNPAFFELLSADDQEKYRNLRSVLSSSDNKYKRNQRCKTLQDAIEQIKKFCVRNDGDDWKRFLVCGICWFDMDIAINTRQLRLLIDKCKSSINGALAKMGYGSEIIRGEGSQSLISKIPFLKGNFVEQRQWTIRKRIAASPYPMFVYSPFFGYAMVTPQPQLVHPVQIAQFNPHMEQNFVFGQQTPLISAQAQVQLQAQTITKQETPAVSSESNDSSASQNSPSPEVSNIADWGDNFECDPCCCCPIEWPTDAEDDAITWG